MGSAALDLRRPALLPETERETALEASRAVARLTGRGAVRVEAVPVRDNEHPQTFVLPAPAVQLLTDMLVHLGAGAPVMVIPEHAELTTQQAADFLNVSRPWIVKLIERQELPHRMVGTHRRLLFSDLRAYKDRMNATRRNALDKLAAETQAMGEYE
jgi:excisionase family DNA binding protein